MRTSIKDPIPEIFEVWEALSAAADAHLPGDAAAAEKWLRRGDDLTVWSWLNPAWIDVDQHVVEARPKGDTHPVPKSERDPDRNIRAAVRRQVLQRDGYRC